MREREVWIDALKGFAILLVVFGHTIERTITGLQINSLILAGINYFIYSFHMPLFFMCSGLLYAVADKERTIKKCIKNKVFDLLLPYSFFAVLVWIGKMVFSNYVTYSVNMTDLLYMYINPIAFLWYIYILFFVAILVKGLDTAFGKRKYNASIILLLMALSRCFITTDIKLIDRVLYYPIFYYVGYLIYEHRKKIQRSHILITTIVFAVSFMLHSFYAKNIFITLIVNLFGACVFTLLFYYLYKKCDTVGKLGYIGQRSFYIYIIHPIVLNAMKIVLIKIGVDTISVWIFSLMTIGCCLPLIYEWIASHISIMDIPFRPRKYLIKN